jgi:hypothetical protein
MLSGEAMHHYIYIREGDLHAWAIVMPLINGKWESFVFFETQATHAEDTAPAIKRRVAGEFDNEEDAEIAATAFALDGMRHNAREIASIQQLCAVEFARRLPHAAP